MKGEAMRKKAREKMKKVLKEAMVV
jgi:hypothetical protein